MNNRTHLADDVRREIAAHLVDIAGPVPAGTSMKEIFRRLETRLAHPEITSRMVKGLWYREVKNIPAHIADHIRTAIEPKATAAFVIDPEGRIRTVLPPGWPTTFSAVRARVEPTRTTVELSPSRAGYQAMATLRHWLLSLLLDERPCRLVDLDRGVITETLGPLAALDRLETMMRDVAGRPATLASGPAMMADDAGVRPLDAPSLVALGVHPEADYDVASFLARNMGIVVLLPEGPELQVLARASGRASRAVENAASFLALRSEFVRLAIWWGGSWLRENEPNGYVAAHRLRRLTALAEPPTPPAPYEGERVALDDVPEQELIPYRPLLSLVGGTFDRSCFGQLLTAGIGDRLVVAEVDGDTTRFLYFPYGPDYYKRDWPFRAIGRPIRDQPDAAYGEAVERRYVQAVQENVVHFERVRATIKETRAGSAGEQRRSSYSRLIVPFVQDGHRLAVAYSSFIRQPGMIE